MVMGRKCRSCIYSFAKILTTSDDADDWAKLGEWGAVEGALYDIKTELDDLRRERCFKDKTYSAIKMELDDAYRALERRDASLLGAATWRIVFSTIMRGVDDIAQACQRE